MWQCIKLPTVVGFLTLMTLTSLLAVVTRCMMTAVNSSHTLQSGWLCMGAAKAYESGVGMYMTICLP